MSDRFEVHNLPLPGLRLLQRKLIGDSRGYLERLFCRDELQKHLTIDVIAQINHTSTTSSGVVRGMHFQYPPHTETKLVSCLRGEVFDVAVDLRRDSPTFLNWHGEILSADNHRTLVIPDGFAHGFQTLCDECEMIYLHSSPYQADAEGGLHPEDPGLDIAWPLPIADLSPRDSAHPLLSPSFEGIAL